MIDQKIDVTGGTGSNFLFEWAIPRNCPEPLFEGVMNSTMGQQGLSFTTLAKQSIGHERDTDDHFFPHCGNDLLEIREFSFTWRPPRNSIPCTSARFAVRGIAHCISDSLVFYRYRAADSGKEAVSLDAFQISGGVIPFS